MINPISVPIGIDRGRPRRVRLAIVGIDLTGATLHAQVRWRADAPGDPIVDLAQTTNATVLGVRLAGTPADDHGLVTSYIDLQFTALATGSSAGQWPTGTADAPNVELAWDLFVTRSGRTVEKWAYGPLVVAATVTREGSGEALIADPLPGGVGSVLAFDAPSQTIVISETDLLQPLVTQAQDALGAIQALVPSIAVREIGLGGADRFTDVGQTTDQLALRSTGLFDLRTNSAVFPEVRVAMAQRMLKVVAGWGHSGMEGTGISFSPDPDPFLALRHGQLNTLPGRLKAYLGADWDVFNMGIGAQTKASIAARFGAIPTRITVSGNNIPASGNVAITTIKPSVGVAEAANTRGIMIAGTINGVPVRITGTTTGTLHQISQVPGASAVLGCPPDSLFVPMLGGLEHAINLFWFDRNGQDVAQSAYYAGAFAAKVKGGRFLFIGTWNWRNVPAEVVGTAGYDTTIAINQQYQRDWGDHFFDKRAYLRGDFPYDGNVEPSAWDLSGLTPTGQDTTDLANGLEPSSFSANASGDLSHNNDAGYDAMAKYLALHRFPRLGWNYQ